LAIHKLRRRLYLLNSEGWTLLSSSWLCCSFGAVPKSLSV
jgi:hypothetical protein